MSESTTSKSKLEEAKSKLAALEAELESLTKSVPELEAAMDRARTGTIPELIAAVTALHAAVGDGTDGDTGRLGRLRDVAVPNARSEVVSAEFDEKFDRVKSGYEPLRESLKRFMTEERVRLARETGIKQIVLTIDIPDEGPTAQVSLAPRASRPAAVARTSPGNGRGRGSSNAYMLDGVTYTSRELVEKFGDKTKLGVTNALVMGVGLTHVADAIAKSRGASKTQTATS